METKKRGRKSRLDKVYEDHIKHYKKVGLDGRPMDLERYRRGFYHPQFEVGDRKGIK